MPLYLVELVADRALVPGLLDRVADIPAAELIEAQVTAGAGRAFAVLESDSAEKVRAGLDGEGFAGVEVTGPDEVRLVGVDLDELKAARPSAGYLVEWDLPDDLDMDSYLARKAEKAPRYAEVPEVSFLRTYVREDMEKCLCFYDAPDEEVVREARRAVSTPIDRLHALQEPK